MEGGNGRMQICCIFRRTTFVKNQSVRAVNAMNIPKCDLVSVETRNKMVLEKKGLTPENRKKKRV